MENKEVSAGGVVYKRVDGELVVQLIQDRFGHVTLAKGKMEDGETIEQTALREIEEETGTIGRIIEPLDTTAYVYNHTDKGEVEKVVHYFLIEAVGGQDRVQMEEIGNVLWLSPIEAEERQRAAGYDNITPVLQLALHKLASL